MKQVTEKRTDIAFFIKLFPLTKIHPDAYKKSKAIMCNRSLKMLEDAFDKKPIPEPKCDTDIIDKNIQLAKRLGISGTPSIILPDGRVFGGALKAETIINYIDEKNDEINKESN